MTHLDPVCGMTIEEADVVQELQRAGRVVATVSAAYGRNDMDHGARSAMFLEGTGHVVMSRNRSSGSHSAPYATCVACRVGGRPRR